MGIYEFTNTEFLRIVDVLSGFRIRAQFRQFTDYWCSHDLNGSDFSYPTLYVFEDTFEIHLPNPVEGALPAWGRWKLSVTEETYAFLKYYLCNYVYKQSNRCLTY